jgi:hypothetical protein
MILLLFLTAVNIFLRLKNRSIPYKYSAHTISLYKDLTFFTVIGIFLLEYLFDFTSYSLMIVPYLITPFIAYSIVEFMSSNNEKTVGSLAVGDIENYILSLVLAAECISSDKKCKEKSIISECYLLSTLDKHKCQCEVKNCICKSIEEKTAKGKLKKTQITKDNWLLFVRQQLNEALLKYPKESTLYITSTCFDFYQLKNYFKAIYSLNVARELNPRISYLMTIMYLERKIEESMMSYNLPYLNKPDSEQSKLDPIKIDQTMKIFNRFMEMIDDCTTANISFWNILLSNSPNIQRFNQIGVGIFEYLKQLNTLYTKIIQTNSTNITFLFKYGVFLKSIIFDDITAEIIFNKVNVIKENKAFTKNLTNGVIGMAATELITMRVSGNSNSFGKILDANSEAVTRLKYSKDELKRCIITQFMPSVIAEVHDEWVKDAYTRCLFLHLNKTVGGFICNKEGYFTYANILIKLLPNLKDNINFIVIMHLNRKMDAYLGFMKNRKEYKEYKNKCCLFLCNERGRIIGMNENMSKWLNASSAELNNKSGVTIESILPEIFDKDKIIDNVISANGYRCFISYRSIIRQLGESEQVDSEKFEENMKPISIWVRSIEETYGVMHNHIVKLRIFIVIPCVINKTSSSLSRSIPLPEEIAESPTDILPQYYSKRENLSPGGSVASSNVTARSNKNLVYEFKAGLYDKKTPSTIQLLMYVIRGFYLLLFASSIVDWILSYVKANDSSNFFDLIIATTDRMNGISTVTIDTCTLDLHIQNLENNSYYHGQFYEKTHKHVVFKYNN